MMMRNIKCLHFCLLVVFLALPAYSKKQPPKEPAQQEGIAYEVDIRGVDVALKATLKATSTLEAQKARPPDAMLVLRRMVERDVTNLLQGMRSEGYFGATIKSEIDENARPVRIMFDVTPGPRYQFESVKIEYIDEPQNPPAPLPTLSDLSLSVYKPAKTADIIKSQGELLTLLKERGFPYPKAPQARLTVDHAARAVYVVLPIDTGPAAGFGATAIHGLEDVHEAFIRKQIPWKEGQWFDARLLTDLDDKLRNSGLFTVTSVATEDQLNAEKRVPIRISVRERPPRTLKAGLEYQSDEGLGARASWQHRNLFGNGESLDIESRLSTKESLFGITYTKPQWRREDQTLQFEARLAEEDLEPYYSRSALLQATLEHQISKRLTLGTGLGYRATKIDQSAEQSTHNLLFIPSFMTYDNSKGEQLNPQSGGKLTLRLTPFFDVTRDNEQFLRSQVTYGHYFKVSQKDPAVVLAGRISMGTIMGASRDDIPADERFYAGGGGSIRGYEYQTVGPLCDDKPLGGRSLLEFSLEVRTRISEQFGIVSFLDGGSAFESSYPDFNNALRFGAGIGLRYFTPLGPVRVDLAVPVNRRSGIDSAFQIYISLGQAF